MADSLLGAPSAVDPRRLQLDRILNSAPFQNAPLLRAFLEFIALETLQGRSGQINEYAIATRVFGRRDDFDPTSATIVRTQAYRLRKKLEEYYTSTGAKDPILIQIPKGHYVPSFADRDRSETISPASSPRRGWAMSIVACCVVALVFWTGHFVGSRQGSAPAPVQRRLTPALDSFWGSFADSGRPVVIGYTNPVFLTNEKGDLLRPESGPYGNRGERVPSSQLKHLTGPLYYEDGFTGSGEVIGVQHLTSLLLRAGIPFIVKRSRMVTLDDLRNHDTIFLGSQSAFQAIEGINFLRRFDFDRPSAVPQLWRSRIADHSDPRISYAVERDPKTQLLKTDYAIFAALPGLVPERRVVLIAGLTTSGTQGAAEFATTEHHLQSLFASLPAGSSTARSWSFESVLRVDTVKGLDAMRSSLIVAAPAPNTR